MVVMVLVRSRRTASSQDVSDATLCGTVHLLVEASIVIVHGFVYDVRTMVCAMKGCSVRNRSQNRWESFHEILLIHRCPSTPSMKAKVDEERSPLKVKISNLRSGSLEILSERGTSSSIAFGLNFTEQHFTLIGSLKAYEDVQAHVQKIIIYQLLVTIVGCGKTTTVRVWYIVKLYILFSPSGRAINQPRCSSLPDVRLLGIVKEYLYGVYM